MHFTTRGLLVNGVKVKTLAINPTRNPVNTDLLPCDYLADTGFESVVVDTTIKPLRLLTNVFRSESYFIERFISRDFAAKLRNILRSESFDIIQLEHLYLCKYIDTIKRYSDAKIVLRPQNVEYVIWERYIKNVRNPLKKVFLRIAVKRLKLYEQQVIQELDGVIPLTGEDAALFSSFSGETPMAVVPMGYDYDKIEKYDFDKQFSHKPVIYHLGAMDWLPNVEAVQWFIGSVIPYLAERRFSAKIIIAGRKMPSWVLKHKSGILEITGEVNNPLEFQEDKQIMIVPLWSGSGIRAKIIEGLALGKTIITTSIGAQGIDYENGRNIIIADTPSEFADQIIKCANSVEFCRSISKNARALSIRNYHYQNMADSMICFYRKILASNE